MCGFAGIYQQEGNLQNQQDLIKRMTEKLHYRGPDSTGYFSQDQLLLGHKRLAIIDLASGLQPMTVNNYTIVYNGELYNTDQIKTLLQQKGYQFQTTSDTEVVLKGYIEYKEKILELIEGMYAFSIYDGQKIFMARDPFGVKPLFYTTVGEEFLFASEIKALLEHDQVQPIINRQSLQELLALGPSKTPGSGIFKDIYELRPAHYLIHEAGKTTTKRYWDVKEQPCSDTFAVSVDKIRELVTASIKKQMIADVPIATLLSGGLDSSIITAVCSRELATKNQQLATFSIDYEGNAKHFKANDFQVASDEHFIELMKSQFNTKHHYQVISQDVLADLLKESVIARDYPGMADIDSSLYWFSQQISQEFKVALSGEGADEIFGGYPWFYQETFNKRDNFPWINNLAERNALLNETIRESLNLTAYANQRYQETLQAVPKAANVKEQKLKELFYLNLQWFMPTLLERQDRMTMRASLEARVPFVDRDLVEYLWNLPWESKFYQQKEKGLLREAFKDLLPEAITNRKKNPYPKTHHPQYAKIVADLLKACLADQHSILHQIFDIDQLNELINTQGASFKTPWFGQLMSGPELIAYLYQFDFWAKEYQIILDLS